MNGKEQAVDKIIKFIKSDEKGLLITGTHQYKKHYLIMALLNRYYKNAHILFRINSMQHITNDNFTPLKKQPKAGEVVKIENNYYEFDALFSRETWHKTSHEFNFGIVYPIDAMCRDNKIEPVKDMIDFKKIDKLFLCSWTDCPEYDYSIFSKYYTPHVVYDVEEEDPAYHNRMLGKE